MKIQIFVMQARIAGIQVRQDASGDIHVNLDSSAPCWNGGIEECTKTNRGTPPFLFSKEHTKILARQSRNQSDRLVSLV